jgi:hypothetical protein
VGKGEKEKRESRAINNSNTNAINRSVKSRVIDIHNIKLQITTDRTHLTRALSGGDYGGDGCKPQNFG